MYRSYVSGLVMMSCFATFIAFCFENIALAQNNSTSNGQDGGSSPIGGDGNSPRAGGAAMADFDTLMNLIQQTIDPDSWLAAGGQSTMLQYPAGVYVDPRGNLKTVKDDIEVPELKLTEKDKEQNPWLAKSASRVVSLRELDRAIYAAAIGQRKPSPAFARLAGLSKINFVRVDVENEDILLCGASGAPTMGFHIEDLAVVASLIKHNTAPIGCSIDPTDSGVRAVQALFSKPGATSRLSRSPATVAEEMRAALGTQKVSVFGINPSSSAAIVLVDADAHMKKVGFGVSKVRLNVDNYFDHLSKQRSVPKQSLVRWWFAYGNAPAKVNLENDTFQLPDEVVTILSEQQWMTATGRAPTGGNDAAADAFAKGFSGKLNKLRNSHPSYARLCAIFETALALQLALNSTGHPDLTAWLPNLCGLGALGNQGVNDPKSVDGIATAKRLSSGTVVAVVSGGVRADVASIAREENVEVSKFLSTSVVPEKPKTPADPADSWWWPGD